MDTNISEELKHLQDDINNLVYDTFRGVSGYDDFSVPCIPRISPQYLKNRFVILAQETDTWYPNCGRFSEFAQSKIEDVEKKLYEERYDVFSEWASESYPGAFWEFTRNLYNKGILEPPIHTKKWLTHCWMNLFCIEKCVDKRDNHGRPSQHKDLAKEVMSIQGNLVFQILALIKPKIILATTAHFNDSFLLKNGLGSDWSQVEFKTADEEHIYATNHLAEILIKDESNPLYGVKILRSYHPNFFSKRINRKNIFIDIEKQLSDKKMTKSGYYQKILFETLKKWEMEYA